MAACNTPQPKIHTRFFYFYLIIYAYFCAYIVVCIHLRMIRASGIHFVTQTMSYRDSVSFRDHLESGLPRVVCMERNAVVYPCMQTGALSLSTRLSRIKPQC